MVILCQQLIGHALANQTDKIEYAELSHVRHGLLSINTWKKKISIIVADEIDRAAFSKESEAELQKSLEKQLNILFDKINLRIKKSNQGTFSGKVKQAFLNVFLSVEDIKKGIPEYAHAMIKEAKRPSSKDSVKNIIKEKLGEYMSESFDTQDTLRIESILVRLGVSTINQAKVKLTAEIERRDRWIVFLSIALVLLAAGIFLMAFLHKKTLSPAQYLSLVSVLFVLLISGVFTPMIDMEAKISQMTFVIFDHPVQFENQVLFFQSKSILDVFWIMITNESIAMKLVGVLLVLFSVIFPVTKLLSAVAYYYDYLAARQNKWINFFVFKSGKWSMADVMVVAIFMAYIGFNGIINGQFGKLTKALGQDLVVVATNGTSLRPSYYLFFTFVLLAMFLPSLLVAKKPVKS